MASGSQIMTTDKARILSTQPGTDKLWRGDNSWSNSILGDLYVGKYTANTAQTKDYQIQIKGGAGGIYIFSQANIDGVVGIGRWTSANAWSYRMYWDQSNNLIIHDTVKMSGTLQLTSTTDAEATADNQPALMIGSPSGAHLEFDGNEIMAKASATTTSTLYLNNNGGEIYTGGRINTASSLHVRAENDTTEGGQISLAKAPGYTYFAYMDVNQDHWRVHNGTNERIHMSLIHDGLTTLTGPLTIARVANTLLGIDSNLKIGTALRDLNFQFAYGSGAEINDGYSSGITWGSGNAAYGGIYCQSSGSYGTRLHFATTDSYANGAYSRMTIIQNGNVGIGIWNPSYKLEVVGTVRAGTGTGTTASDETAAAFLTTKYLRTGIYNGNGDGDGISGTANMIIKSWWGIGIVDGCTGNGMTIGINCRSGSMKLKGSLQIGDHLELWSDGEGGNINLFQDSDKSRYVQIDRCGGSLRCYGVVNSAYTTEWNWNPSTGRFYNGGNMYVNGYLGVGIEPGSSGYKLDVAGHIRSSLEMYTQTSFYARYHLMQWRGDTGAWYNTITNYDNGELGVHAMGGQLWLGNGTTTSTIICANNIWHIICQNSGYNTVLSRSAGLSPWDGCAWEVREVNEVGANQTAWSYAPKIGFHWAGRVACQIGMNASQEFCFYDNSSETSMMRVIGGTMIARRSNDGGEAQVRCEGDAGTVYLWSHNNNRSDGQLARGLYFEGKGVAVSQEPGGEITHRGRLIAPYNQYRSDGTYGIDMRNSDIIGCNCILFNDSCERFSEGIMFDRDDNANYDGMICYNGSFYFGANKAWNADRNGNATLYATTYSTSSSYLVKQNILTISDEEAKKILYLRPVSFDYKPEFGKKNQYGLIAEEVEPYLPYLIIQERPNDYKSLDYSKFVPFLIKMIQIQQREINELSRKLNKLNI